VPAPVPDGWNHNTHYHDLLLESVSRSCRRALDVGCGLGTFARRLSALTDHVDAVDGHAGVIRQARDFSTHVRNIRFIEADFMTWTSSDSYDVISMIAVLHHLPFDEALNKAARLLRPGGVLIVLGLHRAASPIHFVVRGALGYPVSLYYRMVRDTSAVGAPIQEPTMTLSDIRRRSQRLLPGAAVQRHLLWRYTLVWKQSMNGDVAVGPPVPKSHEPGSTQ
jgi:SAM-dependent methyltransferase